MKLLADENLEAPVIKALRAYKFDVLAVIEKSPGIADEDVLQLATALERILVTNDKDFAELAFLQRQASYGIVLVRMPDATSEQKAIRLLEILEDHGAALVGVMTVVRDANVRFRKPPPLA